MKNILFFFLTLTFLLTGCKDKSFHISGKLNNSVKGGFLYLREVQNGKVATFDSLQLDEKGEFRFEGEIEIPTFYVLTASEMSFLMILAEPGDKITINADYNNLNEPESISGSDGTQKMIDYNKALKNTINKLVGLREVYLQNTDNPDLPEVITTIDSTANSYLKEINAYTKKYIDENITSLVSLIALYQQIEANRFILNPVEDIEYFIKVDSSLFRLYPGSGPVKALHDQVGLLVSQVNSLEGQGAATGTGSSVPEIALPSPTGEIIKLSSTRGSVVLLDFWAAWCPPCRRENPNLVEAFNKYQAKGFQIYQVSLDKTREDWVRGIEQDNLGKWIHVSDLKYWNSSVVPLFNIESIPYNLLLDKEGKVITANLRGEALIDKLSEILD